MNGERLEQLSAYLDGELPAEERLAFEAELARDAELRAELNLHKRLSNELRIEPEDYRVAREIGGRLARARRRRRLLWLPLLPLAALALAAVLLWPSAGPQAELTSDDLFLEYTAAITALGE